MFRKQVWIICWIIVFVLNAQVIASDDHRNHDHDLNDPHAEHQDEAKGPHGGRLLQQDSFELEITIKEDGISPEFRVYAYHDEQAIDPSKVSLVIELHRLGGVKDVFKFAPVQDYLKGAGTVYEPHSFDVHVQANYDSRQYSWEFESYEGRTVIRNAAASEAGVITSTTGPAKITQTTMLYGTVRPNEERVYQIQVPYSGKIFNVHYGIGDNVKKGEEIAIVQNRDTLGKYSVKAPASGVIISRHGNPGEYIDEDPLLVIAQLSELWVDFAAFPTQIKKLAVGQQVTIKSTDGSNSSIGQINYIAPVGSSASQSVLVRATLANPHGNWVAGLLVTGDVLTSEINVPLAVKKSALQTFRDFTVVFAKFNEAYEVRMLQLGRSDDEYVEVVGGILPGIEYVVANSYLIKADVLKSGASHDH